MRTYWHLLHASLSFFQWVLPNPSGGNGVPRWVKLKNTPNQQFPSEIANPPSPPRPSPPQQQQPQQNPPPPKVVNEQPAPAKKSKKKNKNKKKQAAAAVASAAGNSPEKTVEAGKTQETPIAELDKLKIEEGTNVTEGKELASPEHVGDGKQLPPPENEKPKVEMEEEN